MEFLQGDICSFRGDAIVNAANDHLWMGSGVAGAIRRAAGDQVDREARSKGPIQVGSAVVTSPGMLPLRGIVHAAVMGQDLVTREDLIASATEASLKACLENSFRRVAFPALGTGVGGFPLRACGAVMAGVVRRFVLDNPGALELVAFYLWGDGAFREFCEGALPELRGLDHRARG
ncbi:LOW QUALITY PROTEIN: putative phosphatase, C-terminal domain of histone macro H2A1 like protein [Thermanaerovibrio velox DSM 12556]|uniref:Putative phosphatase, C-terminal domain of histone macro H2A1 like protein n=1 Tax=Thermanaerovibrio velox DSM 12556 TaxID=926567 RepID=H0URE6_9BACT|nr:LOW QUALITY PROTEIN: putative phosphatase, C-terminal domain of histone macro H2A1 like protein [Thermanaerovibrio velox DSM 12556]